MKGEIIYILIAITLIMSIIAVSYVYKIQKQNEILIKLIQDKGEKGEDGNPPLLNALVNCVVQDVSYKEFDNSYKGFHDCIIRYVKLG
jgi:uncharacterized membrane protein